MPRFPDFPTDEDQERAPNPQEIVDRIINGRLRALLSGAAPRPE